MKYKVNFLGYFDTNAPASVIKDALLTIWAQSVNINVGTEREERTSVVIEKCYHDEYPFKPCEVIFSKIKGIS